MSQTGNTSYTKSMNGLIVFDTGAGTVIEDGTITTENFTTTNFNATTISSDTINADNIQNIQDTNIYLYTNIGSTRTLFVGDVCKTTIGGGALTVTPTSVNVNTLNGATPADTINLYTGSTGTVNLAKSGRINLGENRFYLSGDNLLHSTIGNAINLFNTTTATLTLGLSGRINLGTNRLYTTGNDLLHTTASTAVNLLNTTTGDLSIGSTGKINLGNTVSITGNTIASNTSSDTINLFNNITTGTVNILNGVRTGGALNIASDTTNLVNTAPVNIGGTNTSATAGSVSRIKLNLNGDAIWSNTASLTSFRSANINLATYSGLDATINIGAEAGTKSDVNIGVAGSGKTTTIATDNTTITNNLTMGSNKSIFTTLAQQMRFGYANTQTTATASSSFGPFIKSYGPVTMPGVALDIVYEGTDGLFPTGADGCGGLLTVYMKSNVGTAGSKFATYVFSMAKRNGITGFSALQTISANASGWTTNPTITAGTGNNIRITMNGLDYTGATVSWTFLGCI